MVEGGTGIGDGKRQIKGSTAESVGVRVEDKDGDGRKGREVIRQLNPSPLAAALEAGFSAGELDEDAPHGFGSRPKEVTASLEVLFPDPPQVCLVDQDRGL
jgi:hypothetical protein